jgi:hypothetical protein
MIGRAGNMRVIIQQSPCSDEMQITSQKQLTGFNAVLGSGETLRIYLSSIVKILLKAQMNALGSFIEV